MIKKDAYYTFREESAFRISMTNVHHYYIHEAAEFCEANSTQKSQKLWTHSLILGVMGTPQIYFPSAFSTTTTHLFDGFGVSRRSRRFTNKKFNVKKVAAAFL